MTPFSSYLKHLLLGITTVAALIAGLNAVVDPYGIFRLTTISGLNVTKSRASQRGEQFKREAVRAVKPQALILGNSLAEIGFDPNSSAWPNELKPAFNFALPGTGIHAALTELRDSLDYGTPKLAIVGVNFPDFRTVPTIAPQSALPVQRAYWRERFLALFSLDASIDSLSTIKAQRDQYAPRLTDNGFNPMFDYVAIARNEGYHAMFAQRNQETAKALAKGPKQVLLSDGSPGPDFGIVNDIISTAKAKNIRLIFVIYPYHADLLTIYDRAGLWPAFEIWKRELAKMIAAQQPSNNEAQMALWDFSGLSNYSVEAVPDPKDRKHEMRWYWESGHFKKELGDKILNIVLKGPTADETGFGAKLTPVNIEKELREQRIALTRYQETHARRTESLTALVETMTAKPSL